MDGYAVLARERRRSSSRDRSRTSRRGTLTVGCRFPTTSPSGPTCARCRKSLLRPSSLRTSCRCASSAKLRSSSPRSDPSGRTDPAQARRARAGARRPGRADPRLRARRGSGLPDGRVLHGRLLPRTLRGRDVRAHGRDDQERRDDRPERSARPQGGRQALDRRRRRQDVAGGRPDRRRLRGAAREDERSRARPHRRDARQARVDPRIPHRADARRVRRSGARGRHGDRRADGRPGAGRQAALRAARCDRDRRPDLADRRLDHVEEAGRRCAGDRARRQGRRRRVHEDDRRRAEASPRR